MNAPVVNDNETAPAAAAGVAGSSKISASHVSVFYGQKQAIDDVSIEIPRNIVTAFIGPSGCGKSTFLRTLNRMNDTIQGARVDGEILLDGVDIRTVSRRSVRSRIGMVLQDTWLVGGTIAENIAYGRPGATEAEIIEAARAARVDAFVRSLPDGYAARISDDGGMISAGEKQLITIARAFLARPQLLILDEATSSVDTRTEVLIAQAMTELRRQRTSFIIAHRLSTIRDADMIVVLEQGGVVETGTHTELLGRRGAYWEMTRAQVS
jgi:ATP-binding cassette subfamily B protein